MSEELNQEQPQPAMEQISQELNDWLTKRKIVLKVVAMGNITNSPCDIRDFFINGTHRAEITLVKAND